MPDEAPDVMNPLDATYNAATTAVFAAGFPAFWTYSRLSGRYQRGLSERLGFVPPEALERLSRPPRLWVHAVSLGEIRVAEAIVSSLRKLLPHGSILVSTTTDHGFDQAQEAFGPETPVVYAPIDTVFSVRKALKRVRPQALVFLETEIWPAWIAEAHTQGIRTALVNGRISVRSFEGYRRLRFFFRHVLARIDAFSMIMEDDAYRIRSMGAKKGRVRINGNAKYDGLAQQVNDRAEPEMRRVLNLGEDEAVFVCGSTRGGEEPQILDAFERIRKAFPNTILVMAPRHIERAADVAREVERRGLGCQLRTRLGENGEERTAPVVILDTFGELFNLYSVATLVFCGASLVPLGGQNPLEPAAWGKPVLYGPSMEDFLDAKAFLEKEDADGLIHGPDMLAERTMQLLGDPAKRRDQGERARRAVLGNRDAAERHARVIVDLLTSSTR